MPNDLLLSERWRDGDLAYRIPVPNGRYHVVLYFSENYLPAVSPRLGGTGCQNCARLFHIDVEGQRVENYDPADAAQGLPNDGAGATLKAVELAFDVTVADRVLDVQFFDLGPGTPPDNVSIKAMSISAVSEPVARLQALPNSNGTVRIQWSLALNGQLQSAPAVTGSYVNVQLNIQQTSEVNYVDVPPAETRQFYRLQLAR